jgi:hypothetical protein
MLHCAAVAAELQTLLNRGFAALADVGCCCLFLWSSATLCHVGNREPDRTFLGLGWSSADEKKMRKSFGFGRNDFSRFIDLQVRLLYI